MYQPTGVWNRTNGCSWTSNTYLYDYLKMTGQPTGAIYGLVATGFLTAKDIADGYPVMNGFNNIQPVT